MSPKARRKSPAPELCVAVPRPLPVTAIDHLELFVGNAEHTAAYLSSAFGFRPQARQGPGTGVQDLVSVFVVQGEARLLLTSGLTHRHDAAVHCLEHGDSVKDVALTVGSMDDSYLGLKERGIEPQHLPVQLEDALGRSSICPVDGLGSLIHTYVDRSEYRGWPAPGFVAVEGAPDEGIGIERITTVAMVVQPGTMDAVKDRYRRLMDPDEVVEIRPDETEVDGFSFRGVTLIRPDVRIRLVEPAQRVRRSHLDEFLRLHGGPGVYAVTFATTAVTRAIERLESRGTPLLHTAAGGDYAVTEPVQERTPIVFELSERAHVGPTPVEHLRELHAALERRHRRRADEPLLPREAAGR